MYYDNTGVWDTAAALLAIQNGIANVLADSWTVRAMLNVPTR
jgi:hypothetical protein